MININSGATNSVVLRLDNLAEIYLFELTCVQSNETFLFTADNISPSAKFFECKIYEVSDTTQTIALTASTPRIELTYGGSYNYVLYGTDNYDLEPTNNILDRGKLLYKNVEWDSYFEDNDIIIPNQRNIRYTVQTNIINAFTRLTKTGDLDLTLKNEVVKDSCISSIISNNIIFASGFTPIQLNSAQVYKMEIDSNGKIYVIGGGNSYNGFRILAENDFTTTARPLIRLNPDGTQDKDFDTRGFFPNQCDQIAIDSNGKIYVNGNFNSYKGVPIPGSNGGRIIRLNPDATQDTDFDTGTSFNNIFGSIKLDSNGKIYIVGSFTMYNGVSAMRIIRLNPDGTKDTDFDYGSGFNFATQSIDIDLNGKIYVGGSFTMYNGVSVNRLIRLNPDGTHDTDFNTGTGFNNSVNAIKTDSNGKIYVGGQFTMYNGVSVNRIIRLNPDGTRDDTFDYGTGFNNIVLSIDINSNGKIYFGGAFLQYNGISANAIIRLNPDGTKDTDFDYGSGFSRPIVNSIASISDIKVDSNDNIYVGGFFNSYKGS